jgi:diketogulonate reductase-like aldo/keto reductase
MCRPDRSEVFIETKVWISDYGYDQTLHAFDKSAGKLGVEQIDLLLLHQPVPTRFGNTVDAYSTLEKLLADGRVRAIGVSNFMPDVLAALLGRSSVTPAVNQVELHPYFTQPDVQQANAKYGILTQAWSPMGWHHQLPRRRTEQLRRPCHRPDRRRARQDTSPGHVAMAPAGGTFSDPEVGEPRTHRVNFDVFDFELTTDQIAAIDDLNTGVRGGPAPETVTPEAFGREIPEA